MTFIVKNTTFPSLLDLVAPHSCRGCGRIGRVLCERCKNYIISNHQNICPFCKSITKNGKCPDCTPIRIFTVGERKDLLDDLIHDYKYDSIRALSKELADLMHNSLPHNLSNNIVVVPLPTSSHHIRERGFDHTLAICKHLAKNRHWKVQKIILRAKNTVQVGADHNQRIVQAKSAYSLNPNIKIDKNTTYLLFDDVSTTGSSIKSSIELLQKAGAQKIIVALLAVSKNY